MSGIRDQLIRGSEKAGYQNLEEPRSMQYIKYVKIYSYRKYPEFFAKRARERELFQ
jgi:hypothetical protein